TMDAIASTYSSTCDRPARSPPQGPKAARAYAYAPPANGIVLPSSPIEQHRHRYISVISTVATNRPPNPPSMSPRFQPENSPTMTALTAIAHSEPRPA